MRILRLPLVLLLMTSVVICMHAQEAKPVEKVVPNGSDGLDLTVPTPDSINTRRPEVVSPQEIAAPFSTFRIGLGFIYDGTAYNPNAVFKQQMDSLNVKLNATTKVRDFRILGSGVFRTKRTLAWKFAFMYDGSANAWLVRESGFTIGVPELWGHIFIGRTKEGFSLVKVMNGHSSWGNERQMALDPIPILGDGIKWFGFEPKTRIFWNLGAFNDAISKGQGFSTFEWQYVARIGFMPIYDKENSRLLHIAANLRYGKPNDGQFAIKSRPESNPTPFLLTSGTFAADRSNHLGYEIYYSNKRFTVGSEGMVHNFHSKNSQDHSFYGGDVVLSYFLTGTSRPYKTDGSIYGFTTVRKSVFKGGWGEFEAVLRASTFNVNDGDIKGGQFWRITPMVNWYLSRIIRMEFTYGYGIFDRFGLRGTTSFFESRLQLTVM
ncbi:porin [Chryseolinea sp. T2]|uniref:OprO/OprP family phosphate-selective porin n=1 Tax=Chryseolinea sp. T2 TaxID=3129255 RepID=UPI0030775C90